MVAQAGADQDVPEGEKGGRERSLKAFTRILQCWKLPADQIWSPWGGEADPAGCENGKQLKALTIKSSSVFGQEVVRAALLLKAGFTRTVLFPALCNCTLPIILLLPLCFPCTHFECRYKMDGEGCGRIPVWK